MNKIQQKSVVRIRKMHENDLNEVSKINHLSFNDPWPKQIFADEINDNEFATYFVLEANDVLIGYVGIWFVFDDAQITNIAVHPDYRGQSYGEQLFFHAMKHSMLHHMNSLSLEVRISNIKAQRLYRKFGLTPISIRKKYYKNNGEDAIVMGVNF